MRITDILRSGRKTLSLEFFPPRGAKARENLLGVLDELRPLNPDFVSITCPLDKDRRSEMIQLVDHCVNRLELVTMAHVVCANASRSFVEGMLAELEDTGVSNVLALRGDRDGPQPPDALSHGSELVELLNQEHDFCVAGAAHPEQHPESESAEADLDATAEKVRKGCEFLVTQFFFDNADYFDLASHAAVHFPVPIIPGVMPVTNPRSLRRMCEVNGSKPPEALLREIESCEDDVEVHETALRRSLEQSNALLAAGAPGIHTYTLNRLEPTRRLLQSLQDSLL